MGVGVLLLLFFVRLLLVVTTEVSGGGGQRSVVLGWPPDEKICTYISTHETGETGQVCWLNW